MVKCIQRLNSTPVTAKTWEELEMDMRTMRMVSSLVVLLQLQRTSCLEVGRGPLEVTRRAAAVGVGSSLGAALVGPGPVAAVAKGDVLPLVLPEMGIGAWAWGDSLFWGYSPKKDGELAEVFDFVASRTDGFVDTAELYGLGRSESLIGDFGKRRGTHEVRVASKFAALPWRTSRRDVVKACRASLERLGRERMDL